MVPFFIFLYSNKGGSILRSDIIQVAEIPKHLNEFSRSKLPFVMSDSEHFIIKMWGYIKNDKEIRCSQALKRGFIKNDNPKGKFTFREIKYFASFFIRKFKMCIQTRQQGQPEGWVDFLFSLFGEERILQKRGRK